MPRVPTHSDAGAISQRVVTGQPKRLAGARTKSPTISIKSASSLLQPPSKQPITARLAAAGSRRAELEALLHAAPSDATPEQLRDLVINENVTGKRSAASRAKVWSQLKQNYVLDPTIPEYRAFTQALLATSAPSDQGLLPFLMLSRSDRLFREVTLASVSPHLTSAGTPIQTEEVQAALDLIASAARRWTEETRVTARQHALSALKDFGILEGTAKKKIARIHIGPQVTLFAARLAQMDGTPARRIPDSVWFHLLGLGMEDAWRELQSAAAARVLRCRRQADVVELELPPLPPVPGVGG